MSSLPSGQPLLRRLMAVFVTLASVSVSACSCAAGNPETDAGDSATGDAGMDASDGAMDASDGAVDDGSTDAHPDAAQTCGNGFFDEFETCDPNAGNVSPE